jgi:hypothetical protein
LVGVHAVYGDADGDGEFEAGASAVYDGVTALRPDDGTSDERRATRGIVEKDPE